MKNTLAFLALSFVCIFSGCSNPSAEEIVLNYLKATSLEDRFQTVIQSPDVKHKMEEYYSDVNWEDASKRKFEVESVEEITDSISTVSVIYPERHNVPIIYYLEKLSDGYKINWENSIFYNELDPAEVVISKYLFSSKSEMISFLYPQSDLQDILENADYKLFSQISNWTDYFTIEFREDYHDGETKLFDLWNSEDELIGTVYLREYENGYRILYGPSAIYNSHSFSLLKVLKPTKDTVIRAFAELSSYYNWEHKDSEDTHFSIQLWDPQTMESLYGFILKDNDESLELVKYLGDGKLHPVMLNIEYNPYSRATFSDIIEINDVIDLGFVGDY